MREIKLPFESKVIKGERVKSNPLVYGKIVFSVFENNTPVTEFKKVSAKGKNRGTIENVKTELFLGYDNLHLYVCVKCHEPHMEFITTENVNRNRKITLFPWSFKDDTVEIMLNPSWDLKQSLHLVVNPTGNIYTSVHRTSAKNMEGNSLWRPENTRFATEIHDDFWTAGFAVAATDCSLDSFTDEMVIGLNVCRTRTPVFEKYDLQDQTLAWTTQWTSEIIHEAYKFHPLFLGDDPKNDKILEQLKEKQDIFLLDTPKNCAISNLNDNTCLDNFDNKHEHQKIMDKPIWLFVPDYTRFPGLSEAFRELKDMRGIHKSMYGSFQHNHFEITWDQRILKAAIRGVEIINQDGKNIATGARLFSSPESENLPALTDGNENTCATYSRDMFIPVETFFELQFSAKTKINRILIKHGELSKYCFRSGVPYKNIATDFKVSYFRDGKWIPVPGGDITNNFSIETELSFASIEASAIRIDIENESYSGIDYSPEEAWKWFFEDWLEVPAQFQDNTLESILYHSPTAEELKKHPVNITYLRFLRATPFLKNNEPMFLRALSTIKKLNPEGFLGFLEHEWDSNFLNMSTIESWKDTGRDIPEFIQNLLPLSNSSEVTQKKWAEYLTYHVKRHHGESLFENSWRLGDHFAMVQGNKMPFCECSPNGQPSMQIQMCFTRGAARQWEKPFGTYLAVCFDQGATNHFESEPLSSHIPGEEEWACFSEAGPSPANAWTNDISFLVFGASFIQFESSPELHIGIQDNKYIVSEHGKYLQNFISYHKQYPQPISTYAPIGILMNYDHGYAMPYQTCYAYGRSGMQTWTASPYTEYDYMTNAFFSELYPVARQRIERDNFFLTNSQYGELFDVIGANIPENSGDSPDIFSKYPVVILLGKVVQDFKLLEQLKQYIKSGGIVICNSVYEKVLKAFGVYAKDLQDQNIAFEKIYGKGKLIVTPVPYMLSKEKTLEPVSRNLLTKLSQKYAPFKVNGDCARLFATREDGWDIFLFNNKGIFKFAPLSAQENKEQSVEVTVDSINQRYVDIWSKNGSKRAEVKNNQLKITVASGEFAIIKT